MLSINQYPKPIMGRDKHSKSKRKSKPKKSENVEKPSLVNPELELEPEPEPGTAPMPVPDLGTGPGRTDRKLFLSWCREMSGDKLYTEEYMELLLMKRLATVYGEAFQRLEAYGCPDSIARKAVRLNGHGFGKKDILANIMQNTVAYIDAGMVPVGGNHSDVQQPRAAAEREFCQMVTYSLGAMVYLLQHLRRLTKVEAMWALMISNFHLGMAIDITTPAVEPDTENLACASSGGSTVTGCQVSVSDGIGDPCCSLHDFMEDAALAKRFKLHPHLMPQLKTSIAVSAASCREELKIAGRMVPVSPYSLVKHKPSYQQDMKEPDPFDSVLDSLGDLGIDAKSKSTCSDEKDEIIMTLVNQIKEITTQVDERKVWAEAKVIQAARKISDDLCELRTLKSEKNRLKIDNQELQEETVKRIVDTHNALRKTCSQVHHAIAAARKVDEENSGIRAEIEAFKLSAAESDRVHLEVKKKERKHLKKIAVMEKEKNIIREEIEEESKKYLQLQHQLMQIKMAQNEYEVKSMEEVNEKEVAFALVQDEQRLKDAAGVSSKRRMEALREKVELDCLRCKDDVHRVEHEILHLQMSMDSAESTYMVAPERNYQSEAFEEEVFPDRKCIICMVNEVSVVFLPCAHQVLCGNCSDHYCNYVEAQCPGCQASIEERIYVYGAGT